jgi:hypothetical protein
MHGKRKETRTRFHGYSAKKLKLSGLVVGTSEAELRNSWNFSGVSSLLENFEKKI